MIELSNGHTFEYMTASGALGFDGQGWPWERPLKWIGFLDPSLFTSVFKTLTLRPLQGNLQWFNPFGCIRLIPEGVLNAVALANLGVKWWCQKIGPSIDSTKISLIGSIFGTPNELFAMAKMLNDFDLVGLEINASCPNVGIDILENTKEIILGCEAVKEVSRFPIILKLSVANEVELIVEHIGGMVEALSINSVPWPIAFPTRQSPLAHLGGGGVSGKAAQPFTWGLVKKLVELTSIPVIGPSVWEFNDIGKLQKIGASAVSFGSIFLRYPWRPTLFVRQAQKLSKRRV
jgi:dihydroorotate dehydrogenase